MLYHYLILGGNTLIGLHTVEPREDLAYGFDWPFMRPTWVPCRGVSEIEALSGAGRIEVRLDVGHQRGTPLDEAVRLFEERHEVRVRGRQEEPRDGGERTSRKCHAIRTRHDPGLFPERGVSR